MTKNPSLRTGIEHVEIQSLQPPDFCEPFAQTNHNLALAERIAGLQVAHMVLLGDHYPSLTISRRPHAGFVEDRENLRNGRDRSRQGVFFGYLTAGSEIVSDTVSQVAVKPYGDEKGDVGMTSEVALVHEWGVNTHLNRLRSGTAYDAVGFWGDRAKDVVPRMVTDFMSRSTSLDNTFRKEPIRNGSGDLFIPSPWIEQALYMGNYALGYLHGARITHGDALPQNLAHTGRTPELVFNDTTTFRPFGANDRKIKLRAKKDILDFTEGVFLPFPGGEMMRHASATFLAAESRAYYLYMSYVDGAREGASRSGYGTSGIIVPQNDHRSILETVVRRYEAQYGKVIPTQTTIT